MTPEVITTLADHAQGNLRSLMIMADELLVAATNRALCCRGRHLAISSIVALRQS
jgi:hypothetical protein